MALYTLREMFKELRENITFTLPNTLLFNTYYQPPRDGSADVRPEYVKIYVDLNNDNSRKPDDTIVKKYGDWVYAVDCINAAEAVRSFANDNYVFCLTHDTELKMIYKAFTTDFNPLENYDRYEELKRRSRGKTESSSTSGSKVSPDFTPETTTFFDTGEVSGESGATSKAQEMANNHIHGNIGVTQATDMLKNTVVFFDNNSMYDTLIKRIIEDNCMLIV